MIQHCRITIDVESNFCGEWPTLDIIVNDSVLYSNKAIESGQIILDIDCKQKNHLKLIGIGKKPGQDTKVGPNGDIIADKSLIIKHIQIDSIDMGEVWIRSLKFIKIDGTVTTNMSSGFYENGSIEFHFSTPVIDWVIDEKFIKNNDQQNLDIFSKSKDKFNYDLLYNKINKLQSLLDD